MREIKFRLWDRDDLVNLQEMLTASFNFAEGSPDLMQFTGLLDRNGKEIWEGDIVKSIKSPLIAVVRVGMYEYEDGNCPSRKFCAYIEVVKYQRFGFTTAMMSQPIDHTKSSYEVVGNIYKNPDLLK